MNIHSIWRKCYKCLKLKLLVQILEKKLLDSGLKWNKRVVPVKSKKIFPALSWSIWLYKDHKLAMIFEKTWRIWKNLICHLKKQQLNFLVSYCSFLFDKPHSYNFIWFIIFLVFFFWFFWFVYLFQSFNVFFFQSHTLLKWLFVSKNKVIY